MSLLPLASRIFSGLWLRRTPITSPTTCRSFSLQRHRRKGVADRLASDSTDKVTLVGGTGGGLGVAGPQPYMQPKPCNIRYNPRMYNGGLLPRLTFDDEPVKLPEYQPGDRWVPHRAFFGQNDYIDILGNGNLKPEDFYVGPIWALTARNEFQRVCNLLFDPAVVAWLEEFEPSRLHDLRKRHKFLYGRMNRRKNIKFKKYRDRP